MGVINSKLRGRKSFHSSEPYDDSTPVMGNGYDPFYDAALVGDWDRLVALCEGAADAERNLDEDGTAGEDAVTNGGATVVGASDEEGQEGGCADAGREATRKGKKKKEKGVAEEEKSDNDTSDSSSSSSESQSEEEPSPSSSSPSQPPFSLFVDAKDNTPLHLACRRDPPLRAVRALLALHRPMAWRTTHDGWLPLHLACHCGCDAEVANELLDAMEEEGQPLPSDSSDVEGGGGGGDEHTSRSRTLRLRGSDADGSTDPLLPRDVRGRTPLHLACASSRDPRRRPDLVRLLLSRSEDPRGAALLRDWGDASGRMMRRDLAWGGDLTVIAGSSLDAAGDGDDAIREEEEDNDGGAEGDFEPTANGGAARDRRPRSPTKEAPPLPAGRTPLDLIRDDYQEELDEALLPGFSIKNAIAACRGEMVAQEDPAAPSSSSRSSTDAAMDLDSMYECWAVLSVLVLAAGTPGSVDDVKKSLGGTTMTTEDGDDDDDGDDALLPSFSKPCHDVVQDFQAIHHACQSSPDVCPPQFRELVKKFLQGQVDKRSMGKFSDLRSQWESRGKIGAG